eukprot:8326888-Pyramimonas_sp.AAC.1
MHEMCSVRQPKERDYDWLRKMAIPRCMHYAKNDVENPLHLAHILGTVASQDCACGWSDDHGSGCLCARESVRFR